MSDRKGSRDRKRNRASSTGESVEMYWNEAVYLSGLLPLKPGQTMAAGFLGAPACAMLSVKSWKPGIRHNDLMRQFCVACRPIAVTI
jgi:hypothetical protein